MNKNTALNNFQKNKSEDSKLLLKIEKILLNKRGYVFKMPKPGTPVIALMSGGLDTTVVIAMLLEKYKLNVYPLYINRHSFNSEKVLDTIDELTGYFSKKYPKLFHPLKTIDLSIPPEEVTLPTEIIDNDIHYNSFFGKGKGFGYDRKIDKFGHRQGVAFQPTLYATMSHFYADFIYESTGIKIRSIFGAYLPSNTDLYQYETLTAFRILTLNMCIQQQDYSWQFCALPMEKELGFYFDKDEIVRLGKKYHVPMEKTWTCYMSHKFQCGNCLCCYVRRKAFKDAKIKDKTFYETDLPIFKIKVENLIYKLLPIKL